MTKIAVALSGGVDSAVAAALLLERGFDVVALHFQNGFFPPQSLKAAEDIAKHLDIPLKTLDVREEFREEVVDYFLEEYKKARTPNPCVVCNRVIKFGRLWEAAKSLGCEKLATGHYARTQIYTDEKADSRGYRLLMAVDKEKDQSYFLWRLTQDDLSHILFPVGELTKEEVRRIASEKGLPLLEGGIPKLCFVRDLERFLRKHIPECLKPGLVLNTSGKVIGRHQGLPLYTIGQRRGFETDINIPLYVVKKDPQENTLIVGRGEESLVKSFGVEEVNWINPNYEIRNTKYELRCLVRIRHLGELLSAEIRDQRSEIRVILDQPTFGVAPGQPAVFYQGEKVLGGGIIS